MPQQQRQDSFEIGRQIGEMGNRITGLEEWTAKWEHRSYRIVILAALALFGIVGNFTPKEVGALVGSTIRSFLIGS